MVSQPDKVMRIGTMIKQLLEEVRAAPLDDRSRSRLRDIHASSIRELADGLAPELRDELTRISLPLSETEIPSDAELRIAQAQLVGWLEGLFHGLQAALVAQQMAARNQLEQMRGRALPGPMMQDPRAQNSGGPLLVELLQHLRDPVVVVGAGDLVGHLYDASDGRWRRRPRSPPTPASGRRWACRRRRSRRAARPRTRCRAPRASTPC